MPIITHNTLNAAAHPVERDSVVNESITTKNKSETTNLLEILEAPPLVESLEKSVIVLAFCQKFFRYVYICLVFAAEVFNFRKLRICLI